MKESLACLFLAFRVGPNPSSAGHGHVAAGGLGFTGPVDTTGNR